MSRWSLALVAAAIAFTAASPARAADYGLVRWANGDCKIWVNDTGNMPWGDDWIVLAWNIPTYDMAWYVLRQETALGNCRW
jgi:hypothetical protein